MKRQRAIIQDMSKNLQREILNNHSGQARKVDPVDLSTPTSLHVINRNHRKEAAGSMPSAENDEDELKRFQKIANIYERHNYIKNQI
jgi:hypothetical protein